MNHLDGEMNKSVVWEVAWLCKVLPGLPFCVNILMPWVPKQYSHVLWLVRQHRTANRRQPIFLPLEVKFMLDWVAVCRLVRMQGASTWNIQKCFPH